MLNERRKKILRALVREHVRSARPIGSRALVDGYDLECSPATVRNDLAALEDSGYLFQPHVSAGRIPTDAGYRAFVDDVREALEEDRPSRREIESVREQLRRVESELAELMREAGSLLTRLTNYAAIALAPTLRRSRVCRVDLVLLAPDRLLTVLITDTGQVAKRLVELAQTVEEHELRSMEETLNRALDGRPAEEVKLAAQQIAHSTPRAAIWLSILDELFDLLTDVDESAVYHAGTAALLEEPEFEDPEMVRSVVGLLEDGLLLASAFAEAERAKEVHVGIGKENSLAELGQLSVVVAPYGEGGYIGLLGPTRMDYIRAIRSVRCVADTLAESLTARED